MVQIFYIKPCDIYQVVRYKNGRISSYKPGIRSISRLFRQIGRTIFHEEQKDWLGYIAITYREKSDEDYTLWLKSLYGGHIA